ncbi:MAG: EAL domain-containing protein [Hyphomicrobiales bacterium]|nr:MAG: EAL domain-containing protein [Hyphomicrobiales bacterium]
MLGAFTLDMVSTLRGYVAGESLWSKGQHQAVFYLGRFVDTRDPVYIERYESALASPMGNRAARLALEGTPPDIEAAQVGFAAAGNRPEDIPGLIWMFQNFSWFSYLNVAVTRWRTAEQMVLKLDQLAQRIFDSGEQLAYPSVQAAYKLEIAEISERITPLTKEFSEALGDGTQVVQDALAIANVALAGLFVALTLWRLNRFLTQRRTIEAELNWRATHDALTGLPNRAALEQRAATQLRAGEHALIFVDLDQFKVVNDTNGHAAGDALLCRVAEVLQAQLREADLLARLGGDEFAVLLSDCSLEVAEGIAERLRQATQDLGFFWQGQAFSTTASIGLVHFSASDTNFTQAMQAADMACYMAKEKGRNRVHLYARDDSDMVERAGEMGWVQRLHRALEQDRFALYAQTIMPVRAGGGGAHVEILLRLVDDTGALVPPGSFIPAAERFGLMPQLDRWVVRRAFALLARQQRQEGRALPAMCAINLSGTTINDASFLPFVREQFAQSGIAPAAICFEITETSAIANLDAAGRFMTALREMGASFALDDFGAGMASFGYLKKLAVDYLKIDGSFVRDMLSDRQDRAMVEMINHIGHMMGIRTIAEFVESPEILAALATIGVDYAQGYAIGRPEPFEPALLWEVAAAQPERLRPTA